MWSDNETAVDLCGFVYLVDQLEVVLAKPELRPLTVGLSGGWGSGKSSLMRMTQEHLERNEKNVCCSFSPWRYEDYDDIKHSLMVAVLDQLGERIGDEAPEASKWKRIRDLADRLRLAKLVIAGGGMAAGLDPATATMLGEAAHAMSEPSSSDDKGGQESAALDAGPISAGGFRDEFESLLADLAGEIDGVYVFIDDLDRCMPRAVVDTLEAIRLFLHVPNTAYVIAADPRIVRNAIASQYASEGIEADDLGTDYLEKIWQLTVSVPALATPEVETYVSLLFAQLHLDADSFQAICARAEKNRREHPLDVAMNYGFAKEVLGEVPSPLEQDLQLANLISPQISEGLRGNPREIKRFLNTLLLKLEASSLRGIELKPPVLAKLMILEERHLHRFRQLYRWQASAGGRPLEIAEAEKISGGEELEESSQGARDWAGDGTLAAWLQLDPSLDGVDLGPYFSYARDKIFATGTTSRLPGPLQGLLAALLGEGDASRKQAIRDAGELEPASREMLFAAACEATVREPTTKALRALAELAKTDETLVPTLVNALDEIPGSAIPYATPLHFKTIFGEDDHRFDDVLSKAKAKGGSSA